MFGKIEFNRWYGTTINYTSTKNVKGIMRLVEYDKDQDMMIFERVEGVGYSGASSTLIHVFLPTVASIHVEAVTDRQYDRELDNIASNPIATAWMTSKAYRARDDEDGMPKTNTERYVNHRN